MRDIIELIRVKHWIKNFLIFIPLICSKSFGMDYLWKILVGFMAFNCASSFIYIVNDLRDIENDKADPRKKNRPLPAGKISVKFAIVLASILLIVSLLLNYIISDSIFNYSLLALVGYIIINIIYSFGLKNVAILDVILLASGFVIRVYYGACLIDVEVSNWLFLTILSFSLFMGIGKRKKEMSKGAKIRKVLVKYTDDFLDRYQHIFIALTFVFYSLWTMEQNNKYIVFTVFFIFFIFMRYSLVMESGEEGDPTTLVYKDKVLLFSCLLFSIVFSFLFIMF